MKVLLIEDDTDVRNMILTMLNGVANDILEAGDGSQGLKLIRDNADIDLVITDIIMPDKEGIETIQELKRDHPHLKIIAISGGGKINPEGYLGIAKAMGADYTLAKPFVKNDLINAVNQVMS